MKVRSCALGALLLVAYATNIGAQAPTYEDGSEADVFYYLADEESPAEAENTEAANNLDLHDQLAFEENLGAYEPGVMEPSSCVCGECDECGGSCGCNGCQSYECGGCNRYCNPLRGVWARGEYLMWWMSGATCPPLVTTSPDGTPITDAGVLPDAEILFPTERLGIDGRSGGRVTLGYWFNDWESWGVEGSFFGLDKGGDGFQQSSDTEGSPILARPFIDAETGLEDSFIVAYPDVFAGTITVASSSDVLGAEVNLRHAMAGNQCCRFDLLAGYRFLKVNESLSVFENQIAIDPGGVIPLGTEISIQDNFVTRNEFHGGQVGMIVQKQCCRWTLEGTGKVAFGSWNQRARIGGFTSVAVPNVPVVVEEGGILALASNSGNFERDRFAAIPEVGLALRYQLTPCWKVNVGYTFLYLARIVRPANNIDRRIDIDQIPPPVGTGAFPEFKFKESDAWLQGVSVGLECRF